VAAIVLAAAAVCLTPRVALAYDRDEIQGQMINIIYCEPGGYVSTSGRHEGIDFALRHGAEICSMIDGEVTYVSNSSSLSTCAIYDHARDKTVV
jgi:murein DD-endopeptidase MepM/ murein hydrolase activator NlpD